MISFNQILKYFKGALIVATLGAVVVIALIFQLAQNLPSLDQLENYDPDLITRIYSSDGEVLDELFFEKRIFVSLDQIPNNMKNAVVLFSFLLLSQLFR